MTHVPSDFPFRDFELPSFNNPPAHQERNDSRKPSPKEAFVVKQHVDAKKDAYSADVDKENEADESEVEHYSSRKSKVEVFDDLADGNNGRVLEERHKFRGWGCVHCDCGFVEWR